MHGPNVSFDITRIGAWIFDQLTTRTSLPIKFLTVPGSSLWRRLPLFEFAAEISWCDDLLALVWRLATDARP